MFHCTLLWPGGGLVSPQSSNEEKKNPEKPPNSPVVYIAIKGPFLPFLSQASETANPSTPGGILSLCCATHRDQGLKMGRRQGPKVAASHEPPEAQGQLASLPCVAMETAPAGIRGQKQDFRRGCQQFPDPHIEADPHRYHG